MEPSHFVTDLTGRGGGNKRVMWKQVEISENFSLSVLGEAARDPKPEGRSPNLAQPEPKRRGIFGRNIWWQENYRKPTGDIQPRSDFREAPSLQGFNAKTQRRKAEEIFGRNMAKGGRRIEAALHAI